MPTTVAWINKPEGIIQFNILPQREKKKNTPKTPNHCNNEFGA